MNQINLTELSLENIGQWPILIKAGALLLSNLLIIVLGYWLVIGDNFAMYQRLNMQEGALKAVFEKKQRQVFDLVQYNHQLNILNERFALMLKQLPVKNEIPGLLEEISKTGVAAGLQFELFVPQPEAVHDFYVELPIKLSVTGSYFQLAKFVNQMAEMSRLVTLHDFTIERVSASEHQVDELAMSVTAKIYRYRTP